MGLHRLLDAFNNFLPKVVKPNEKVCYEMLDENSVLPPDEPLRSSTAKDILSYGH